MLDAVDAGIVSKSPVGITKVTTVIAKVFEATRLSALEQVAETMLLRTPHRVPIIESLVIEAVGPRYEQTR